jgi:predicted ATPase
MAATFSRFCIEGLHNNRTVDITIEDNQLVLVGENGTGKSTVVNYLYFFLTMQWQRLLDYEFTALTAEINGEMLTFTREEIQEASRLPSRRLPVSVRIRIEERLHHLLGSGPYEELLQDEQALRMLARKVDIPSSMLRDHLLSQEQEERSMLSESIKKTEEIIRRANLTMLYLPTYRRIEQELEPILRSMYPDLTAEFKDAFRGNRLRKRRSRSPAGSIEMTEFGMDDVQEVFARKMGEIKDIFSDGLNKLVGTYLSDIIRRDYQQVDPAKFAELDETTMDAILERIDERILSRADQDKLRELITHIRDGRTANNGQDIRGEDRIIAHFWMRLTDLYKKQQDQETDVWKFAEVCNQYLSEGKHIIYDNVTFKLGIHHPDTVRISDEREEDTETGSIPLKMLSSGEKQIISLFSHIYLSGNSNFFLIIDEPELSLSVPWQQRFLPDILNSGKCRGLVAATHSPFIFDNNLDLYTHDIKEFTRPFKEEIPAALVPVL